MVIDRYVLTKLVWRTPICADRHTLATLWRRVKVRTVICGRLAEVLRVRSQNTAPETGVEVIQPRIHYISGNGNGHVPPLENNDVRAAERANAKEDTNSLRSTSDVLYNIRDLMETNDVTPSASTVAAADENVSSAERLLASIDNQLKTKLRSDARLRHETDKKQQMIGEWMVVAAVIDRICFIVFSLCFVIGTCVLFMLAAFIDDWQLVYSQSRFYVGPGSAIQARRQGGRGEGSWGSLRLSLRLLVGMSDGEGTPLPSPHVSSLWTPSASRSRRIRNEVVIGPRDNLFPGPAVALDRPGAIAPPDFGVTPPALRV